MKDEDIKVGMHVRIGKGKNVYRVASISRGRAGSEIGEGVIGHIGLVADYRPDHGTNGGSNRGSMRNLYRGDFNRLSVADRPPLVY